PNSFDPRPETDEATENASLPLSLLYNWKNHSAEALWLESGLSPAIRLDSRGIAIGEISSLPGRTWTPLATEIADRLRAVLDETSFVRATVESCNPVTI